MDERQLPALTPIQMEALRRFASFQMAEDELARILTGAFEINFETVRQSGRARVPDAPERGGSGCPSRES